MRQRTKDALMPANSPDCSIIVPIHNEEAILAESISSLIEELDHSLNCAYELILCENGSTDSTASIAENLSERYLKIRVERLPLPSYGRALRQGIEAAQGRVIVIVNADFWDVDFTCQAMARELDYDVLVASKNIAGAHDQRPWHRRAITVSFNLLLRLLFSYKGTDTHGLKALKAVTMKPLSLTCRTSAEVFDTELLIRTQRANLRLLEVPISIEEWRPSRYGLLKRIPRTMADLFTLIKVLTLPAHENDDSELPRSGCTQIKELPVVGSDSLVAPEEVKSK